MAYLSVPTRHGSLFQNDKTAAKVFERKRAQKTDEYYNRHTRKSFSDDGDRVTINVGAKIFKTRKSTLRNVPGTTLSCLEESSEHYDRINQEYFFDRNPFLFTYILDYYRTGSMHLPRNICALSIREEIKFWELGDGCISECCRKFYFDELDDYTTYELIKDEFYSLPTYTGSESDSSLTIESRLQEFRRRAWVFIDNHESSIPAKVFAVIYYGLIILTILNLFISTVPSLRQPLQKHVLIRSADDIVPEFEYLESINGTMKILLSTDPPDSLVIIDVICLIFFTADFIFRLFVSPSLRQSFRSWYTLLDILYLVPAWTKLLIDVSSPFFWQQGSKNTTLLIILDAMVVLRVFRIFRLFRHYRGLRVLLLAVKASVSELMLLVVFVLFSLTIYSSLVFCAEQYSDNQDGGSDTFHSIFYGLWWALITLTTVGYGDIYPLTTVGRIIACLCAITGLLIIGMVVPIIAGNFHLYYGFRHAGCEDFELYKPDFVPTESENPLPDIEFDNFIPKDRRLSARPASADHIIEPSRSGSQKSVKGLHGPIQLQDLKNLEFRAKYPRNGNSTAISPETPEVTTSPI
ncbi:potassium voltage-gated channel protein Shaw-like [Mercenaria mercenaria]|uniref:potassium voltage-gated channel protein Shaw-like n=1 Tax=Mercenaria mercenaria TaxID=6596 RepID=UPI00234F7A7F|nr:potassium voltage-gated channel protein Shaw-like [Mercenaria mercenaria]